MFTVLDGRVSAPMRWHPHQAADGSHFLNPVRSPAGRHYRYERYMFSNVSEDIRELYTAPSLGTVATTFSGEDSCYRTATAFDDAGVFRVECDAEVRGYVEMLPSPRYLPRR